MTTAVYRSTHCLIDRPTHLMAFGACAPIPRTLMRVLYRLDPSMHFTPPAGLLWRMLGVSRSTQNPNICTL